MTFPHSLHSVKETLKLEPRLAAASVLGITPVVWHGLIYQCVLDSWYFLAGVILTSRLVCVFMTPSFTMSDSLSAREYKLVLRLDLCWPLPIPFTVPRSTGLTINAYLTS